MLEYIILGFLMHGDMSGYDIKQFMKYTTANFYDASFGSIYPMLKKMETDGTITSKEAVDAGKYKKVYTITESGKAMFFQWLHQPIVLNRSRQDFLVHIFFLGWLPVEKARALTAEFIKAVENELAGLEALEQALAKDMQGGAHFFEMATLDFGKSYYAFARDWCVDFLGKLDNPDSTQIEREGHYENSCIKR